MAAQLTLFDSESGDDLLAEEHAQKTSRLGIEWHAQMLKLHGQALGARCGTCAHLLRYRQGTTWLKCAKAGQTASSATDWRARFAACGKYEAESMRP